MKKNYTHFFKEITHIGIFCLITSCTVNSSEIDATAQNLIFDAEAIEDNGMTHVELNVALYYRDGSELIPDAVDLNNGETLTAFSIIDGTSTEYVMHEWSAAIIDFEGHYTAELPVAENGYYSVTFRDAEDVETSVDIERSQFVPILSPAEDSEFTQGVDDELTVTWDPNQVEGSLRLRVFYTDDFGTDQEESYNISNTSTGRYTFDSSLLNGNVTLRLEHTYYPTVDDHEFRDSSVRVIHRDTKHIRFMAQN